MEVLALLKPLISNCDIADIAVIAGLIFVFRELKYCKKEFAELKRHVTNHLEHKVQDLAEQVAKINGYIEGKLKELK